VVLRAQKNDISTFGDKILALRSKAKTFYDLKILG
jgi:hypothetical protein